MPPALALLASLMVAADGPPDAVWLEGESATAAAAPFAVGTAGRPESLSGRKWLVADAPTEAAASWPFTTATAGRYEVWVRSRHAGPFRWRVAGRPWVDVPSDAPPLDLWPADAASAVGWVNAGAIDLAAGSHTLELAVPKPARIAVDVVCLSRGPFRPDGPNKPGTISRAAIDAEAAGGFEFPPPAGTSPRRTLELAGTWQAARWDELTPADRAAPVTALPADLQARTWRGVRVPGELAEARPEWAYCHRFLIRTRFTLPSGGQSVTLRLANACLLASVFVNGTLVGTGTVPHAPFTCDLGAVARPGVNELVVAVKDHFYAVAGTPWDKLRLLPPPQFAAGELTQTLDWPVRTTRRGGLLEAPVLSVAGPVVVSDVFARPAADALALDVTVRNPTPTPRTVEVRPVVRPTEADGRIVGGTPAKAFAPKSLTVPAGGEASVSFAEAWSNPRLWWPDDPVVYAAEITLVVDGRPSDEQVTRFGVREWGTAGTRVTLNGIPWRLTASREFADPQPAPQKAIKAWRASGVSLFRLAGERPWTGAGLSDTLRFFDASGVPVLRAGFGDDGPPANRQALFLARVRAERNSPAVAAWELPPGVDVAAVRAIDTTRPVLPAVSPPLSPADLPTAMYDPPAGPQVADHTANPGPAVLAAIGGESAYLDDRPAADRLTRMRADGDRWRGAAVTRLDAGGGNTWKPVAVLVREWDTAVPSGQPLARTLKLVNDTRSGTPLTVHWLFRVRGQPGEVRGKKTLKLPPGGGEEFPLTLALPPGDRLDADLVLSVEREGREVFRDVRPLRLVGPPAKLDAPPGTVAVYDPAGKLPGFAGLQRVADPFAPPPGCRVLVVGPDAVSRSQATDTRWRSLAAGGLRLVVLDQTHPLHGPAVPADLSPTAAGGRFAFPTDAAHPAFAGLVPADFACWSNGETVYRGAYAQPSRVGRSLVSGGVGLADAAVVEVPVGDGRMLLSQLAVRDHPTDPVARRVVANLVRYALGDFPPGRPLAVLLPPGPRRSLLAGSGLRVGESADLATALAVGEVVLLDGTAANLQAATADRETLDTFFAAGGWLVAWGVEPDGLPAFNKLVGVEHLMRPFGPERVTSRSLLSTRDLRAADLFTHVVDLDEVAGFATARPGRPGWAGVFPRRESVSGLTVQPAETTTGWARVLFDDDPATALTVRLDGGRQEIKVDPPRPCTRLSVEPVPAGGWWEDVQVRVKRPADFAARVQPLASVGGLVKYPRGAGGVLLCQVKPADDPRKRRLVLDALRSVGVTP